jgi:hypothetical protein
LNAERTVLAMLSAAWFGGALGAGFFFPLSIGWLAVLIAVLAAAMFLVARPAKWIRLAPCIVVGAAVPWLERAEDAETRPLGALAPAGTLPGSAVQVSCGTLDLRVDPILRFQSTSPDRCWSLFNRVTDSPAGVLRISRDAGEVQLEAFTTLTHDVYAHLNHFARLDISGQRDLRVDFSAVPGFITRVEASDYPVGRPMRFAYLGEDHALHVVEATSAEKGPFHQLAKGQLDGDALELTLYDGDEPQCTVALETFGAQASVALSPTAGWGAPVNAIELIRDDPDPRASAAIVVSLAATSVGRGWDTVGHRAGTYLNRMRIRRAR